MAAVRFYTIMDIMVRKCYYLILKLFKSNPMMIVNHVQARFG